MYIQFAATPVEILAWQRLVLAEPSLSHTASRIATRLSLYINAATGLAWPSLRTLAADSSTSYSSVKRAIKDLVGLGLLQVEPGDAQHTNRYRARLPVAEPSVNTAAAPITPPPPAPEPEPEPIPTDTTPAAPATPPPSDADDPAITQVIDHLNRRADTAFPSAPGSYSHSLVRQALRHQPPEILCAIVDLKTDHWAGTERARYLRPETLFNPARLENYLSELHQHRRTLERTATDPTTAPQPAPAASHRAHTRDAEAVYSAAHALYVPEPPPKRPPAEVVQPYFEDMYRMLGGRPRRPHAPSQAISAPMVNSPNPD